MRNKKVKNASSEDKKKVNNIKIENRKKVLIGKIISNKMQGTVVVQIERKIKHPIYKKYIRRNKKIKADINNFELEVGNIVKIEEISPISKDKHFKVIEKE